MYVAIATKFVHRLWICPLMHNWKVPLYRSQSYILVCAVVWHGTETRTHTHGFNTFCLAMPNAKCNKIHYVSLRHIWLYFHDASSIILVFSRLLTFVIILAGKMWLWKTFEISSMDFATMISACFLLMLLHRIELLTL